MPTDPAAPLRAGYRSARPVYLRTVFGDDRATEQRECVVRRWDVVGGFLGVERFTLRDLASGGETVLTMPRGQVPARRRRWAPPPPDDDEENDDE